MSDKSFYNFFIMQAAALQKWFKTALSKVVPSKSALMLYKVVLNFGFESY